MYEKNKIAGKKKPNAMLFLNLMMICIGAQASLPSEVSTGLQKIQATTTQYGQNAAEDVQKFNKFLQTTKGANVVNSLSGPISTIGDSMDDLTTGTSTEPTIAALKIVVSISKVLPEVEPVIEEVGSIFSSILGLFGVGGDDMEVVVKKAVDEVMEKTRTENIRDEAYGVAKQLQLSQAYLKSLIGERLTSSEVSSLSSHIPIFSAVSFIGSLENRIKEDTAANDQVKSSNAAFFLNLWMQLSALRLTVIMQMYTTISASGQSHSRTAQSIMNVINHESKQNKNFIQFLANPSYEKLSFFTKLNPAKQSLMQAYLNAYGMQMPYFNPITNRLYTIQNVKYKKYMGKWSNKFFKTEKIDSNSKFRFEPVNSDDGFYYIRILNYYVVMKGGKLWTYGGKPGLDGKWKIVKFGDGNYMMTTSWNYGFYAYMNDLGWIDSPWEKGDPGTNGHWKIQLLA